MDVCIFCGESLEDGKPVTRLREKGSDTINKTSVIRKESIITTPGQKVHQECRRDYINPNTISKDLKKDVQTTEPCRDLRSATPTFQFRENCIFCGNHAKLSDKKKKPDVFTVRTLDFSKNIMTICKERNDDWSQKVIARLNIAPADLHAADAIYHQRCSVNFRTGKHIPCSELENKENKRLTPGRPIEDQTEQAFMKIVAGLQERQDEQVSVNDLVNEMEEICGDKAFSAVHMKKKLQTHFGSSIHITEVNGKCNVVTFRRTVSAILHDFYSRPSTKSSESEKKCIIETAAKLIKADILSLENTKCQYPTPDEISSVEKNIKFVPGSLRLLLGSLFSQTDSDVKIGSIGQAIVQATRPRSVISPLQIGLGIQMHHQFSSRFLLDTLNTLGFSSSYSEIQKFELNAAASNGKVQDTIDNSTFTQYVADNIDHNIRTLDGHGTFHGMDIIKAVTPGFRISRSVPRNSPTITEIIDLAKINIDVYKLQPNQSSKITFQPIECDPYVDMTWKLDLLSKVSLPLSRIKPSWSAIMHKVMNTQESLQ